MANQEQFKLLVTSIREDNSCKRWNEWRKKNPEVKVDLSKVDLYGGNLQKINFQGADLAEANLQQADLQKASLEDANLQGANLRMANLQGANLRKADIQNGKLQEATLQSTDFRESKMQNVRAPRADFYGAYFQYANLQGASFYETKMQEANFQNANLQEVSMTRADLRGAKMQRANLIEAKLDNANLERANLNRSNLADVDLSSADLTKASLQNVVFNPGTKLSRVVTFKTKINRSDLDALEMDLGGLSKANIRDMNIRYDLGKLSYALEGPLSLVHRISLLIFVFPYALFFIAKLWVAFSSELDYSSLTLGQAFLDKVSEHSSLSVAVFVTLTLFHLSRILLKLFIQVYEHKEQMTRVSSSFELNRQYIFATSTYYINHLLSLLSIGALCIQGYFLFDQMI